MDAAIAIRIPPEVKHNVLSFCTTNSCASLARVHTSYQGEAERAIYRCVALSVCYPANAVSWKILGCLETLSTNREKASMVRSLALGLQGVWQFTAENDRAAVLLLNALPTMYSLTDLRVRLSLGHFDLLRKYLRTVLRDSDLRLQTLYCDQKCDVSRILEDQPTLQFLGVYTKDHHWQEDNKKLLHSLQAHRSSLPMSCAIYDTSISAFHIGIFPTFYPSHINICRALENSFKARWSSEVHTSALNTDIKIVTIFLKDFSNMIHIRRIVENVVLAFPRLFALKFSLQHPDRFEIKQPVIKDLLLLVPCLNEVAFLCWDNKDSPPRYGHPEKVNWEQAKEWGVILPKLSHITFLSGLWLKREAGELGWVIDN